MLFIVHDLNKGTKGFLGNSGKIVSLMQIWIH